MRRRPIHEDGADPARFEFSGDANRETGTLRHGGSPVAMIPGVELVGHFAVDDLGWLIVTDCDSPYEETVYLTLLDQRFQLLETKELGGAYVPGIVQDILVIGANRFSVLFPSSKQRCDVLVKPSKIGLLRRRTRWLQVTLPSGRVA